MRRYFLFLTGYVLFNMTTTLRVVKLDLPPQAGEHTLGWKYSLTHCTMLSGEHHPRGFVLSGSPYEHEPQLRVHVSAYQLLSC